MMIRIPGAFLVPRADGMAGVALEAEKQLGEILIGELELRAL